MCSRKCPQTYKQWQWNQGTSICHFQSCCGQLFTQWLLLKAENTFRSLVGKANCTSILPIHTTPATILSNKQCNMLSPIHQLSSIICKFTQHLLCDYGILQNARNFIHNINPILSLSWPSSAIGEALLLPLKMSDLSHIFKENLNRYSKETWLTFLHQTSTLTPDANTTEVGESVIPFITVHHFPNIFLFSEDRNDIPFLSLDWHSSQPPCVSQALSGSCCRVSVRLKSFCYTINVVQELHTAPIKDPHQTMFVRNWDIFYGGLSHTSHDHYSRWVSTGVWLVSTVPTGGS